MSTGMLRVEGDKVVGNDGKPVTLKGAAIGGWMNMENFITGYVGHEHEHRAAMLKALGPERYENFFDKWLQYFFTDADAKFYASLGLNCLRIPFNYHHFEDDMKPRVLKEGGFKHLDRVIELCEAAHLHNFRHARDSRGTHRIIMQRIDAIRQHLIEPPPSHRKERR